MRPGNVPTSRIGPLLGELIKDRWPHDDGVAVLADKVGCDWTAIEGIVKGVHEGVSFDLADKLFCALGRVDLWQGQLKDVYDGISFVETCALHSCNKTFPEKKVGSVKHYCSRRCSRLASDVRRGKATGERHRQRNRCLKGHPLVGDNLVVFASGGRTCRECRRQRQAAQYRDRYARDPAFAEKQRQRNRDYRQKAA